MKPRERVTVGTFTIEFLRVTHSIPDCVALAIETPHGVVIHTGDFKIDQTPIDGEGVDVHRLAQLGASVWTRLLRSLRESRATALLLGAQGAAGSFATLCVSTTRERALFDAGLFEGLASRDRKSTRLNSSHIEPSRMPSSA